MKIIVGVVLSVCAHSSVWLIQIEIEANREIIIIIDQGEKHLIPSVKKVSFARPCVEYTHYFRFSNYKPDPTECVCVCLCVCVFASVRICMNAQCCAFVRSKRRKLSFPPIAIVNEE